MKNTIYCSNCGEILSENDTHMFDDSVLCSHCLEQLTTCCSHCGETIWLRDACTDNRITLCHDCLSNDYCRCSECNIFVPSDDAWYDNDDTPYCPDCYEANHEHSIHNYGYKPQPFFFGDGALYMGVELEIDRGGELEASAETLLSVANAYHDHLYIKRDGSIHDGFECVSHPMTLDYHISKMPWADIMSKAISLGYRSHNTDTCGLHIHVNRSFFGELTEDREFPIGRVVFFVEKHWNELVRFSRRTPDNLYRWANKYATISDSIRDTYDKAKQKTCSRYVAVNLENRNTIEFRLFRGTLRYKTFIAALQLVDEICRTCTKMTDFELEELSWSEFVLRIDQEKKKELVDYLKSRRLYVNELPILEEEV